MSLTGSQIVSEVLDNLTRTGVSQTTSGTDLSTRCLVWVNRAQRKLARKYDLLFKESTATTLASQKSYSFPSNVRSIYDLRLENGFQSIKLDPTHYRLLDSMYPKPSVYTNRQPLFYIPFKSTNTFELFPIPDQGYTVRMRHSYWPTDLTPLTTSDWALNNIDMDEAIIALATSYGFAWLQEYVDSKFWQSMGMDAAKETYLSECDSIPDWAPRGQGFNSFRVPLLGEYYNDPFITQEPNL